MNSGPLFRLTEAVFCSRGPVHLVMAEILQKRVACTALASSKRSVYSISTIIKGDNNEAFTLECGYKLIT